MTKKQTSDDVARASETMVERLTRLLNAEETRIRLEKDPTKRQTAVRTVTMLCAELRKAEKEARRSADELAEPEVLEWFRRLDGTRQSRFLRELQTVNASSKRSGLA
jgi:hypothetical protein